MAIIWIKEQVRLWLTPNNSDFSEVFVGYDFAIRPEITGLLTGQTSPAPATQLNNHGVDAQTSLDEHELAIG